MKHTKRDRDKEEALHDNVLDAIDKVRKASIHSHEDASVFYRELADQSRGLASRPPYSPPVQLAREIAEELLHPLMSKLSEEFFHDLQEVFEHYEGCANVFATIALMEADASMLTARIRAALKKSKGMLSDKEHDAIVRAAILEVFHEKAEIDDEDLNLDAYDHEYPPLEQ